MGFQTSKTSCRFPPHLTIEEVGRHKSGNRAVHGWCRRYASTEQYDGNVFGRLPVRPTLDREYSKVTGFVTQRKTQRAGSRLERKKAPVTAWFRLQRFRLRELRSCVLCSISAAPCRMTAGQVAVIVRCIQQARNPSNHTGR